MKSEANNFQQCTDSHIQIKAQPVASSSRRTKSNAMSKREKWKTAKNRSE